MSNGRTIWWGKDVAWWEREAIVELGEEFGPVGPAVLDWLSCRAKAQNDGGTVKAGYRAIARGVFSDAVTVGHVVSRAVTLGALDDFIEDGRTFTCRISGWSSDQGRADAAARKAKSRAKSSASHGQSRSVTPGPKMSPTEEKRREVEREGTREREPELSAAGDDQQLQAVVEVLRSCPRLTFDAELLGVAHAIRAFPTVDPIKAAHIAASNASDPNYRTVDAGKALRYALSDLDVQAAKRSRHLKPVEGHEREQQERADERASIQRLIGGQGA